MKTIVTLVVCLMALVVASPVSLRGQPRKLFNATGYNPVASPVRATSPEEVVVIKETPSNNIGLGGYNFAYELSDGQRRDETAEIETRGPEDAVLRVTGSFSWVDPRTGQVYTVNYIADENGFQPQGPHLPVSN